jgi:carbon storage regulator
MLVLGRKIDESIMIGDDIVITILGVDGDRVKVGIQAPAHIRVLRQELYETIKEENLRAAKLSAQTNETLLPSLSHLFQEEE